MLLDKGEDDDDDGGSATLMHDCIRVLLAEPTGHLVHRQSRPSEVRKWAD